MPFNTDLTDIKNLVFSPCGVAGIAYAGVVKKLEEEHLLNGLEAVSGISSGSYAGLMLALGYDSKTIEKLLVSKDFRDFSRFGSRQLRKMIDGWTRHRLGLRRPLHGLLGGENLRIWAEALLVKRTGNPHMTFAQMAQYRDMAARAAPTIKQFQSPLDQSFMPARKWDEQAEQDAQKARRFFEKKVEHALKHKRKFIRKYKLGKGFRFDFEKVAAMPEPDYWEVKEEKETPPSRFSDRLKKRYFRSQQSDDLAEADFDRMVDELICIAMGFKKFYTLASWIKDHNEFEDFSKRYQAYPLDEENTPEVRLSQAIRLSASFPIWFRNGVLRDHETGREMRFTDGGLAEVFHTSPFDKEGENRNTLLVHTLTDKSVKLKDRHSSKTRMQLHFEGIVRNHYNKKISENFIDRLAQYYDGKERATRNPDNQEAHKILSRLVVINRGDVEASDFGLSDEVQEKLRKNGYEAMSKRLALFKEQRPNLWSAHKSRYPDGPVASQRGAPPAR